jgi:hypothetical protein
MGAGFRRWRPDQRWKPADPTLNRAPAAAYRIDDSERQPAALGGRIASAALRTRRGMSKIAKASGGITRSAGEMMASDMDEERCRQ